MDNVHSKYNLTFKNEKINNLWIRKTIEFTDRINEDFTPLKFYLYLIHDSEIINEILIDLDKIINGNSDYSIRLGSENIEVNRNNIEIHDQGYTNIIPVTDFKVILQEYNKFLNSKPYNGSYINKSFSFKKFILNIFKS